MLTTRLVFFFLIAACASAQTHGRLSGSVTDPTGAAVPAAAIRLTLPGETVAVISASTTEQGLFSLSGIRPETYDLIIEAPGFRKHTVRKVKVDPGRETSLAPIALELGTVNEVVEVAANLQGVQTSNAEVSTTLRTEQIRGLPMIDRSPLALILTQPGVSNGRGNTVINGQRTTFSSVTLDGINIQDNLIRENGLDFLPNLLLLDQVSEITVATSNPSAASGGGSSQIMFTTPSGTNSFHGNLFWSNRNNITSSNTWFNNQRGLPRGHLNQNQAGGSIGGPIVRNKLLFYANYELFRLKQQITANRQILTSQARQGIFTYVNSGGAVQQVDLLRLGGFTMDPTVRQLIQRVPTDINNFTIGDSRPELLKNTAGYSYPIRSNRTRDNITGKLDYYLSDRNNFAGTFAWNRDILDRPDGVTNFNTIPDLRNDNDAKFISATWRWNPRPTLTNELRGGFNLAPGIFAKDGTYPEYFLAGLVFTNPVSTVEAEGRYTNTYQLADNVTWNRGRHNFEFGFQSTMVRTEIYHEYGITPTYTLGFSTNNNRALAPAQLPGISAADYQTANALLSNLAGVILGSEQDFNIASRTSGFVPGARWVRNFPFGNHALYFQDKWKVNPRLTLTLGLRYDYWTVMKERDGLGLLPVVQNNDVLGTLRSNASLDFAGPLYNKDLNNFGPNFGLAWDFTGRGKTVFRAGYAISYVYDEHVRALWNTMDTNRGLLATTSRSDHTGLLRDGPPRIPTPVFRLPRTFRENFALDPQSAFAIADPNLRMPYLQQFSAGIQHQVFRDAILEVRYVGNHGTGQLRAVDYNQIVIRENGFLDDFNRARNNGFLAQQRNGVFDPRFNPAVPGSQQLTVFPRLSGGALTNSTVIGLIQTGAVAGLANLYQVNGFNPLDYSFYRNQYAQGLNVMGNASHATYNGLQIDFRRQTSSGIYFQANYTFSKVLSDSVGEGIVRFEPYLDFDSPRLERSRTLNDLNHVFKANWVYDLPVGKGHRFDGGPLSRLVSGWKTGGFLTWQSGTPFSVLSARDTLNRQGRSGNNTANTTLNYSQLQEVLRLRMTGNGPMLVPDSVVNPRDGRAVAPDGGQPFAGQIFFNPSPGGLGALQRRMFSGPQFFNLDLSLRKMTTIREGHSLELVVDAVNVLNHTSFFVGDQSVNSTQFGRLTTVFTQQPFSGRRVIQLGLTYRF